MNTEQERAEFEAWLRNKHPAHALLFVNGRYIYKMPQSLWEAYQAGRAALQSQASGQSAADEIEGLRAHVAMLESALAQSERENDELRRAQPAASAEPCFCDRMYPDSNPDATCGDCPRDYWPAASAQADRQQRGGGGVIAECWKVLHEAGLDRQHFDGPLPDAIRAALAAQTADDARDAARWREVERRARKDTAYDRYGHGAHWSVGVFSDDSRQTFGETIDAAMQRTSGGEE